MFYNMNIAVNIIYKLLDTGYNLGVVMLFCLVYRGGAGLPNPTALTEAALASVSAETRPT